MFRAYGDQPILAFRMILDGIVAPDDSVSFTGQTIPEIEKELAYWKTNKTARVARSRKEAPTSFPIPVRLFRLQVSKYIFHTRIIFTKRHCKNSTSLATKKIRIFI